MMLLMIANLRVAAIQPESVDGLVPHDITANGTNAVIGDRMMDGTGERQDGSSWRDHAATAEAWDRAGLPPESRARSASHRIPEPRWRSRDVRASLGSWAPASRPRGRGGTGKRPGAHSPRYAAAVHGTRYAAAARGSGQRLSGSAARDTRQRSAAAVSGSAARGTRHRSAASGLRYAARGTRHAAGGSGPGSPEPRPALLAATPRPAARAAGRA